MADITANLLGYSYDDQTTTVRQGDTKSFFDLYGQRSYENPIFEQTPRPPLYRRSPRIVR